MFATTRRDATTMKSEHDFSRAQRGNFSRKHAVLNLPFYLDANVRNSLAERAKAKGIQLRQLVNDLRRRDIGLSNTSQLMSVVAPSGWSMRGGVDVSGLSKAWKWLVVSKPPPRPACGAIGDRHGEQFERHQLCVTIGSDAR